MLEQRDPVRRGAESAQQELGGAMDDIGVRPVEHGDGDQQRPLWRLAQFGDEVGYFLPPVVPCALGCRAPLCEPIVRLSGLAGSAHQVGEVRDLPHRPFHAQELIDGDVGPHVLLVRHAVHAQVSPEHLSAGWPLDGDPVVLEIGVEGAAVWHDDDKMCLVFVYGLAERGEAGPCRGPLAVVGGGQIQQQLVTASDQRRLVEGQFLLLSREKFMEDAAVPVAFAKKYAGRGGTAAARSTVQDDGAGVGEQGAGLAHADRLDQHAPQPLQLVLGDTSEGWLVRVLRVGTAVDVDVAGTCVYEALRVLDSCTALLVHRLSSSRRSGSPNRCWTLPWLSPSKYVIPLPEKCRSPDTCREFW